MIWKDWLMKEERVFLVKKIYLSAVFVCTYYLGLLRSYSEKRRTAWSNGGSGTTGCWTTQWKSEVLIEEAGSSCRHHSPKNQGKNNQEENAIDNKGLFCDIFCPIFCAVVVPCTTSRPLIEIISKTIMMELLGRNKSRIVVKNDRDQKGGLFWFAAWFFFSVFQLDTTKT